jgi:hypothetical protein
MPDSARPGATRCTGNISLIEAQWLVYRKVEVVMSAPVEIRAVYDSVFEKGRATEWFVFVIEGNDIRLRTYFVSPLKGGSPTSTS